MNYRALLPKVAMNLIGILAICAPASPAVAPAVDAKSARSTNFAINLFKREALDTKHNVVISPFSAYMALGMTANGASGRTRSQMAQVLGVSGDDFPGFNTSNHTLVQALTKKADVLFDFANISNVFTHSLTNTGDSKLEIANALYADNAYPFKQSFLDLCQKEYLAERRSG